MAADKVRSEVIAGVRMLGVDQLVDCCEKLNLTVAETKKGIKKSVENIIMRHLTSETLEDSEDEGMAVFLMLNDHIKTLIDAETTNTIDQLTQTMSQMSSTVKKDETTPVPVKVEAVVEERAEKVEKGPGITAGAVKTKVELHKLREFKITGGTVPDTVDFINLFNQMADGIESGYGEK
jgi:hypothetical protein